MADVSIDQLQRELQQLKELVERIDTRLKTIEEQRRDAARRMPR